MYGISFAISFIVHEDLQNIKYYEIKKSVIMLSKPDDSFVNPELDLLVREGYCAERTCLLILADSTSSNRVLMAAYVVLNNIGKGSDFLISQSIMHCFHGDHRVRTLAMRTLGKFGHKLHLAIIYFMLNDSSGMVSHASADVMAVSDTAILVPAIDIWLLWNKGRISDTKYNYINNRRNELHVRCVELKLGK
jgi:hypothetical protein